MYLRIVHPTRWKGDMKCNQAWNCACMLNNPCDNLFVNDAYLERWFSQCKQKKFERQTILLRLCEEVIPGTIYSHQTIFQKVAN